jgi:hypothetical protein
VVQQSLDKQKLLRVQQRPRQPFGTAIDSAFELRANEFHFLWFGAAGEEGSEYQDGFFLGRFRSVKTPAQPGEPVRQEIHGGAVQQIERLRDGGLIAGVLDRIAV